MSDFNMIVRINSACAVKLTSALASTYYLSVSSEDGYAGTMVTKEHLGQLRDVIDSATALGTDTDALIRKQHIDLETTRYMLRETRRRLQNKESVLRAIKFENKKLSLALKGALQTIAELEDKLEDKP